MEFLHGLEENIIPERCIASRELVAEERLLLMELMRDPARHRIYGVNTLVGHMDGTGLTEEEAMAFQAGLIRNHSLKAGGSYFDDITARAVSFARAWLFAQGGSGISPQMYDILLKALTDRKFRPRIPADVSYSCGDVIPGANWAEAFMAYAGKHHNYSLKPKEGLSLINGIFVHLGVAISAATTLIPLWNAVMEISKINAGLCSANISNYTDLLTENPHDPIKSILSEIRHGNSLNHSYKRQDPVSIRAFPQAASALCTSINRFLMDIETGLQRRSDNPLVSQLEKRALSQGSFVFPELSLSSSQLTDALLMTAWIIERRVHHTLSGNVEKIPVNFGTDKDPMGFVQIPKLLTGILENMRKYAGIKTFSTGSSTSYGIEDFWSHGLFSANILKKSVSDVTRMLVVEAILYSCISGEARKEIYSQYPLLGKLDKDALYGDFQAAEKLVLSHYSQKTSR